MTGVTADVDVDVRRTQIDGVPTFWLPVEGPFTAGLMFRVGRCDEQLARGGVTHLVEHLALYPFGAEPVRHPFNGYVDNTTTVFHAQGEPDEVATFLTGLCRSLHDLPLQRFEVERTILASEAESHQPSGFAASLLRWRYGPRTFGLAAYPEHGLRTLRPDDVGEWADRHFTSGNVALWLSGEPPAGMTLPLPSGDRFEVPAASSALTHRPAWYAEGAGGAAGHVVVERSSIATALAEVTRARLVDRLRYELGASYSPQVAYEQLTGCDATIWLAAEAVEGHEETVSDEVMSVLRDVADGAGSEGVLTGWRDNLCHAMADPAARRGLAHSQCWTHLLGGPVKSWKEVEREADAVTLSDVAVLAGETAAEILYRLPEGQSSSQPDVRSAPLWSEPSRTPQRGRLFAVRRESVDEPLHQFRAGSEALTLLRADGHQVRVRWDECEAVLAWAGGRRVLFGADGFILDVAPELWIDGDDLVEIVDDRVPGERRVDLPDDPEEQAERPAVTEPWGRWAGVLVLALGMFAFLALLLVGNGGGLGLVVWGFFLVRRVRQLREVRSARGLRGRPRRARRT